MSRDEKIRECRNSCKQSKIVMLDFTVLCCFIISCVFWGVVFSKCSDFDCVDHNKLWEILKEMGIQDHLTCLLRNLYAGQETTVRTRRGTMDWFQKGKGVFQAVYCHPAYLTYMQSTS